MRIVDTTIFKHNTTKISNNSEAKLASDIELVRMNATGGTVKEKDMYRPKPSFPPIRLYKIGPVFFLIRLSLYTVERVNIEHNVRMTCTLYYNNTENQCLHSLEDLEAGGA